MGDLSSQLHLLVVGWCKNLLPGQRAEYSAVLNAIAEKGKRTKARNREFIFADDTIGRPMYQK